MAKSPRPARPERTLFLQEMSETMAVQQKDKQPAEQDRPERRHLNAVVGKHVLDALGQPDELRQVQVRPLWDDCYRVNIFVGVDAANVTIAHSFFLVADG